MIELIFVIVILGILAAVAIPKLSATRDDAKVSALISNARTVLSDFTANYTSKGPAYWTANSTTVKMVTNIQLAQGTCTTSASAAVASGTKFLICDGNSAGSVPCLTIEANATHATIANSSGASTVCTAVKEAPVITTMTAKPVQLGGIYIKR